MNDVDVSAVVGTDAPAAGPADRRLLWGDLHKHLTGPGAPIGRMDRAIEFAREHLDVSTVLCYPFQWYREGRDAGVRVESVGHHPRYDDWWETVQRVAREHNDPGTFVTLPAYEWHGDRTRWGDHNVLYFDDGGDIEAPGTKPDLYDHVRDAGALAVPHHTAYAVGHRGADWDVFEPALSPVVEVYSSHGASESVDAPVAMDTNVSMGPRTSGGTARDLLARGHHVGFVASNDGPGLPGEWGRGLAGLWAGEHTRDGVREALTGRHTYGVTGDRIELWWSLDGHPMGAAVDALDERIATATVDCPRPLDRVELLHDGEVVATYVHRDRVAADAPADGTHRVLVEFGWGPTDHYGDFEGTAMQWNGRIGVEDGRLERVWPRFVGFGQRHELTDDGVAFDLHTCRDEDAGAVLPEASSTGPVQGFVVAVAGDDPTLRIDLDDAGQFSVPVAEARERAHLFALLEESWDRLDREFDVTRADVDNPDVAYHNARKVKIHPAAPDRRCRARVRFEDLPTTDGTDWYYVRAAQVDGQYAWGSPVLVG